jgi:probable HAF family extracellular repeat protein
MATASAAFGINEHTQVVGQSITCDFTGFRAFLWENGSMIDLNLFVPPDSNLTLTDVETINDRGEMFGIGTLANGNDRAFLLIPCDENHPNIEGCDYTMVDVPAQLTQPGVRSTVKTAGLGWRWRRSPWFHFPSLGLATRTGDAP